MDTPQIIMPLDDALILYRVEHFATRNFSDRTRHDYAGDIADLILYLTEQEQVETVQAVTLTHLEGYLGHLDREQRAGSSRRRKVSSIRSFFGFLTKREIIDRDPTLNLIPPAKEQPQPRVLSENEYKRLRESAAYHPRDLAIIEVFLQTGMRLTEITRLTLDDIELPSGRLSKDESVGRVRIAGEGRKARVGTLNWKACKALRSYVTLVRPATDDPHVFITKFGKGIGRRSIENIVTKYLTDAGIPGASVHSLRHTAATHWYKKGVEAAGDPGATRARVAGDDRAISPFHPSGTRSGDAAGGAVNTVHSSSSCHISQKNKTPP